MRVLAVAAVGLFFTGLAFGEAHYIGVDKCAKMCHKSKNKGEQYTIWQGTKHAQAFDLLATPEALGVAKKAGVTGDPQKSDKCIKCHVTAFGVPAAQIDSTFSVKQGVQCEACHGAGSGYAKMSIMKNQKEAIAAGLLIPNEKTCVKCHNSESPTFKSFNYAEMYKKIAHPIPKEAAPAEAK